MTDFIEVVKSTKIGMVLEIADVHSLAGDDLLCLCLKEPILLSLKPYDLFFLLVNVAITLAEVQR